MSKSRLSQVAVIGMILVSGLVASAQSSSRADRQPAPNAWMSTATPYLEWKKDISPALRSQRDAFWDGISPREWPITAKKEAVGSSEGDWFDDGKEPEIPDAPNRAILTATFTAHCSVLSASEKSIYSEITMRVEQVFEDKTGSGQLAPHKDITLMLDGGTVTLKSGASLSDHVQPTEFGIQPERSYLLVLEYHADGDWYELNEDWDITDGVVKANTGRGKYLAKHGRSRLDGIAVTDLGPVLSKEPYASN